MSLTVEHEAVGCPAPKAPGLPSSCAAAWCHMARSHSAPPTPAPPYMYSCLLAPSDAARCTVCPGETTMEACETNILVVCPSGYTCCRQTKRCGSGPCFVKECVNNPQACH